MAEQESPAEWRVMCETVPGASHLRAGIPNQDAVARASEAERGLPVVVSVSDGHGSDKCFRSDRGSGFAVKRALELVGEFLGESRAPEDLAALEGRAREQLPRELVRRWREEVEADLKAQPFTPEELAAVERKDGAGARALVEANPALAYGATSLTVAVTDSFVLFLQLGDGEILTVSDSGEVARALPEDARLFANETTSLCTSDAEKNFRLRLRALSDARPALVLLSTDGYANSFADSAGFLKVGSDLLDLLRSDGFDFVNSNLKGWLEEATRSGSGDDCTLALVCRADAVSKTEEKPEVEAAAAAGTAPAAVSETTPAPAAQSEAAAVTNEVAATKTELAKPATGEANASAEASATAETNASPQTPPAAESPASHEQTAAPAEPSA